MVVQLRLSKTLNQQQKNIHLLHKPFRRSCRSCGTLPSASPSTAGLGLPQMPLDAAIGRVLVFTPYRLGGCHGRQFWHTKLSCGVAVITFQSQHSKGTKQTLYSAHQSKKLRRKVECHDESGRTQPTFQLLNANNGHKLQKLPITKEACQKVGGHDRQQLLS